MAMSPRQFHLPSNLYNIMTMNYTAINIVLQPCSIICFALGFLYLLETQGSP